MKSLLFCPLAVLGLVAAWPAQASATEPQDLLEQLDANGDGLLSAAEAGATHRLLFERLVRTGDDDGDGQLDGAELTAALTPVTTHQAPRSPAPSTSFTRSSAVRVSTTSTPVMSMITPSPKAGCWTSSPTWSPSSWLFDGCGGLTARSGSRR